MHHAGWKAFPRWAGRPEIPSTTMKLNTFSSSLPGLCSFRKPTNKCAFVLMLKALFRTHTSGRMSEFASHFYSGFQFPAHVHSEKQLTVQILGLCSSNGRSRLNSQLLAAVWLSPNHWGIWGLNKQMVVCSLTLSLSVSFYVLPCNGKKRKNINNIGLKNTLSLTAFNVQFIAFILFLAYQSLSPLILCYLVLFVLTYFTCEKSFISLLK